MREGVSLVEAFGADAVTDLRVVGRQVGGTGPDGQGRQPGDVVRGREQVRDGLERLRVAGRRGPDGRREEGAVDRAPRRVPDRLDLEAAGDGTRGGKRSGEDREDEGTENG